MIARWVNEQGETNDRTKTSTPGRVQITSQFISRIPPSSIVLRTRRRFRKVQKAMAVVTAGNQAPLPQTVHDSPWPFPASGVCGL